MTVDEILLGIIEREGEGKPPYIVKGDRGGRTRWGISERWHPEAWLAGPPSIELAQHIYHVEYAAPWYTVKYDPLRVQLVDYSVLHGLPRAKLALQQLGVKVTSEENWADVTFWRMVNNALVAVRLQLIDRLSDHEKSQKQFEEGWEDRALLFLALEPI